MSRQARLCRLAGLAAAIAALASMPAMARGDGLPRFRIPATNGYGIAIEERGAATLLTAIRPSRPPRSVGALSTYVARGRVSPTIVDTRFGSLGSVDMRFRPSAKITRGKPARHCDGRKRTIVRYGVFVGDVRFRGEDGYTSARAHRAKGEVVYQRSHDCLISALLDEYLQSLGAGKKHKEVKKTTLASGFRSGVSAVGFEATRVGAGKVSFHAAIERTEGSLGFYRAVFATASPLTFAFDSALSFGSVSPPPPFSGTASLRRNADGSKSWAGSLAVSFPGEPDVPLVGPKFKAQLTRTW
jgi:hypothetical protein